MTIDLTTLILIGAFVYFAIGAAQATAATMMSLGFAGKFDPIAIVIFFAWPLWWVARIPPILGIFVAAICAASVMTWFVWKLLP